MNPEPLALTSLASRIGSPAKNVERTIDPVNSVTALGLALRRMKAGLTVAEGQLCHCMSSAVIDWPSGRSDFATRTSTVSIAAAMGSGSGLGSDPLAR